MFHKLSFIILFLSAGIFLCSGCKSNAGDAVAVSGTIANIPGEPVFLYQFLPDSNQLIDSVNTDEAGKFSLNLQLKQAGFYTLKLRNGQAINLILSPGENAIVTGDGKNLKNQYRVEGSKGSKLYAEYQLFTNKNLNKVDSLSKVFAESRHNKDFARLKQQLDTAYLAIFASQKEQVISFIQNNLNALASLLVISENFGPNPVLSEKTQPDLYLQLDSALYHLYPDNSFVKAFHVRMSNFKSAEADTKKHDAQLQTGMPAPEISLPDASGKAVKLSSRKGKLTLLYFWSSWNAPSRQANINLTPIFSRYHSNGFEIFAVSLDADTDLWKRAYMLDKAYWTQVIDTSGLKSEYSKTFVVKNFPTMMLIGRDGRILARNPDFNGLEELIKKNL